MKALITGGAGFIGSTLCDRLLNEGHSVTVIDNLHGGKLSNLERARSNYGSALTFHELDIRDESTQDVVASSEPEVVFHLAAQMDVRRSVADPVFDASVNVIGALNVLEGARKAGTRKFTFASSGGTIYGAVSNENLPVNEEHAKHPLSPYGITKRLFTDYLHAYKELYDMDYASLALANVFGPRQDPHGEAGVVAIFANRLLGGEQCLIYGDGEATRDYAFVDDVVDAFVRAANAGSGLYNIGTGIERSTNDLYKTMAKAAGVDTAASYAPSRIGELERSALDNSKAKADLGWSPQVSFEDGAAKVLEFVRASQS